MKSIIKNKKKKLKMRKKKKMDKVVFFLRFF